MRPASIVTITHIINTLFMPFRFPAIADKMAFGIGQWAVFQFCGKRIIPAVEEAKHRYHGDNFANFGIREMPLQRIKMACVAPLGWLAPACANAKAARSASENCGSV